MTGHVALVTALTTAAGFAMTRIGVAGGLLQSRVRRRRCSCGRLLSREGCERCGL
jgi:hypothetical protein